MTLAAFECSHCGEAFEDELPPFDHIEAWPTCCGFDAYLMELLRDDSSGAPLEALSGLDEPLGEEGAAAA